MTKISAKIVADSVNEFGNRITSFELVMPRFILAEGKTHRILKGALEQTTIETSIGLNDEVAFSRNSASSRAIPFKKMVEAVEQDPFIPIAWQKTHTGMQGTEYLSLEESELAKQNWLLARDKAVEEAVRLHNRDITKQLCNRLLEPFMWHKVLVTATEFSNFFELRCPQYECKGRLFKSKKDLKKWANDSIYNDYTDLDWLQINKSQAEIHIQALAEAMWDAVGSSTPKSLKSGEYHIPYMEIEEDL